MFPAVAAASTAIDALKALTSTKPVTGVKQDGANLFAFSADASASSETTSGTGGGKSSPISPETMSALLAAQSRSGPGASAPNRADTLKDLFSQIDVDGDGKLTKSEFADALGAGGTNVDEADDVFSKLDKDGGGSVSLGELMSALTGKGQHRNHPQQANVSGDRSQSDPLMQALDGSLSTAAANASASSSAASSYHFMDQLVQRQSSLVSARASSSLSVSV
jgi:hypothetical protein